MYDNIKSVFLGKIKNRRTKKERRTRVLLILAALLFCTPGTAMGQQDTIITIGTGTNATNYAPLANRYRHSRAASIYLSNEINKSGWITQIEWYCNSNNQSITCNEFKIYLTTTGSETFANSNSFPTSATCVYSRTTQTTVGGATGWKSFRLDEPFYYDGSSNLIVIVTAKTTAANSNLNWRYSTANNRTVYYGTGQNTTSYGELGTITITGRSNNRPNVRLTFRKFYFSATATPTPAAGGSASVTPTTASSFGTSSSSSSATTTATFTATPNSGYRFLGWSTTADGAIESTANPYEKTITSTSTSSGSPTNTRLYAQFEQMPNATAIAGDPDEIEVCEGGTTTFVYNLTPSNAYDNVTITSSPAGRVSTSKLGNTITVNGLTVGEATITLSARNASNVEVCNTTVNVNIKAPATVPTIGNYVNASGTVTINPALGTTVYYTTNGNDPTNVSTEYTAPIAVSSPITIKAIAYADGYCPSTVASKTIEQAATPTINISASGMTFSGATGATYYYTTDGTEPTTSSNSWNDGGSEITGTADGATIKVFAVISGKLNSEVATGTYRLESGLYGNTVILNDLEEHSWSYYSDADQPIRSLSPADVTITYYGDGIMMTGDANYTASSSDYITSTHNDYKVGAKVNVGGENENTFIYYKTLERGDATQTAWTYSSDNQSSAASRCPYKSIPNPFQVRPRYKDRGSTDANDFTGWRGFQCWRLKSVTGGAVYSVASGGTALTTGAVINAETEIYFAPDAEYGMKVDLEAVWARAYVKKANQANDNPVGTNNVGYERNFCVPTTGAGYTLYSGTGKRISNSTNVPVTISCYYPDGTAPDNIANSISNAAVTLVANTKFENIPINLTSNTLTAANHDLIIGRGCTGTVNSVRGMGGASSNELNYMIRLESGQYTEFAFIGNGNWTMSDRVLVKSILGSDYDRAKNDNSKLNVSNNSSMFYSTGGVDFSNSDNKDNKTFDCVIKSGTYQASVTNDGAYNHSIYCGHNSASANPTHYPGTRYITIEGGNMASVNGGRATDNAVDDENVTYTPGVVAFYARVKGGTIRGSVFGGAADNSSGGTRKIVITGGEIRGWVAAGSNGTNSGSIKVGRTHGNGIIYVGGRSVIGGPNATAVNGTNGGQVFGAGRGTLATNYNTYLSGTFPQPASVYNSYVVIADEAEISNPGTTGIVGGNVYGGGNYGTLIESSNVYILGGTIQRNVYGGAYGNYETIPESNVIVKGGTIGGSVYGGSNQGGKVEETNVSISGGTVSGSAFGAGLGTQTTQGSYTYDNQVDNTTVTVSGGNVNTDVYGGGEEGRTNGNTSVNISGGTVGQDVYGGGALANVGTNSSNTTTVTITGGIVQRNVYGGGLGSNSVSALVNGKVAVAVYGGRVVENVFGCNNIKGAPQNTVTVDIYGTDPAPDANHYALGAVYGGGNLANYEYGTPTVTVHNCSNSIGYVYGGGNAAHITNGNTDVTIYGGNKIGTVFGGGNGAVTAANVSGNTSVKIYGGTILKVFGGSNSQGTIGGTISVNVDKKGDSDPEGTSTACDMIVGEVYGGGNVAASNVGSIEIGCTGTLTGDHSAHPENIGVTLEGVGSVYGGANQANITGNITLNINDGIVGNVFGGNNTSGTISGTIAVNINKTGSCEWYVGNVFGGGNQAAYSGSPVVTVTNGMVSQNVYGGGNEAGVNGSTVNINGGGVGKGIYGGCNTSGTVNGNIVVNINGGTLGTSGVGNAIGIFGGGFGSSTATTGNVTVNIGDAAGTKTPVIYGDIYGGSALGNVNSNANNLTKIDFLNGTLHGNIYGGGLGDVSNAAKVNGEVQVNISSESQDLANCHIDLRDADIYGCNNTNGSPQADVTVHIWKTGFTTGNYSSQTGTLYAIDQVFGGGNEADYAPENGNANSTKKATVYVHDCLNTIRRVFGGGNKAAATGIVTTIEGGRYDYVFGGGNGEVDAANVGLGGTNLTVHSGIINHLFGGSNTSGVISGPMLVSVDYSKSGTSGCDEDIHEFFGGGNLAELGTSEHPINLTSTIACGTIFGDIYGGSNLADIYGDITLIINGGTINNVYGGSKGRLADNSDPSNPVAAKAANIHGTVTLEIHGGNIGRAFGGCNINGNITDTIGVILDWSQSNCSEKSINYIYGASNDASYTPTETRAQNPNFSPRVDLIHGTVNNNVYGGGKGSTATVTANPKVTVGKVTDNAGKEVEVMGSVFGGGDAANVTGKTNVRVVHNSKVGGNVFGGGNQAAISQDTEVEIKDQARIGSNVYGGGNEGAIGGNTKVIINSSK